MLILLSSMSTSANETDWNESDIPRQELSPAPFTGMMNTGNANHNFFKRKVDMYNSRYGASNPQGDLKYMQLGKLYNMNPHEVCMQLEVSCQSKLAKRQDCTLDSGDGLITCNGLVYRRDDSINNSSRHLLKQTESNSSETIKASPSAIQR
ncbi:hypothetical protein HBN50_14515 [Halobacteriovorax sp. GB3]|uniref:hypothetical protein n=1 Tax=Halobacteriovorax sp. GB3 TaxID=2719615 RepID=UPI00235EAE74|nr:hypothetical protein [Halobacteriovorax sp. GB3]MDD0854322.1 hypothetical protein [Halobacteriovorax sp. GB3]